MSVECNQHVKHVLPPSASFHFYAGFCTESGFRKAGKNCKFDAEKRGIHFLLVRYSPRDKMDGKCWPQWCSRRHSDLPATTAFPIYLKYTRLNNTAVRYARVVIPQFVVLDSRETGRCARKVERAGSLNLEAT